MNGKGGGPGGLKGLRRDLSHMRCTTTKSTSAILRAKMTSTTELRLAILQSMAEMQPNTQLVVLITHSAIICL